MRLLILGGTQFLGRAVARLARAQGHDVTCAARGVSGAPVPGVRFVAVDRDDPAGLAPLDGDRFDAVIDVTRRLDHARHAVAALADRVDHVTFVSSISAYAQPVPVGSAVADTPLLPPAPADVLAPGPDFEHYGELKVSIEQEYAAAFPRLFVCRAGLIIGPEDPTDRFPYWVRRLAAGGEVLAPAPPDAPVQYVDVDDLAGWLLNAGATGLTGTYDGIGAPVPRAEALRAVAAGVGVPDAELTWVDPGFLQARDVRPWSGERSLPLWVPDPEWAGFLARDAGPALAAGLVTRPVADTARVTLAWMRAHPQDVRQGGLEPAEEAGILREWHAAEIG
ncbi:reductase [Micromonospora sp. WMMD882]|uniref:NAD-dependent epimerase/dehydratase family protein n=1 Tax=Micromonospora sp. WMMD882 TaxID=3015151 RepID=UPI00248B105C|nr:NAD-dependent epimerase/dehydratase family protein [Micromonospora sp. WMMD882]WBB79531.1 reductase [Micromonospora sp. WMMD882]